MRLSQENFILCFKNWKSNFPSISLGIYVWENEPQQRTDFVPECNNSVIQIVVQKKKSFKFSIRNLKECFVCTTIILVYLKWNARKIYSGIRTNIFRYLHQQWEKILYLRYEVFKTLFLRHSQIFWNVTPCLWASCFRRFERTQCPSF
jgi:hypothetical protein